MNRNKQQQLVALFAAIISVVLLTSSIADSRQPRISATPASTLTQATTPSASLPAQNLPVPGWLGFATVPATSQHRFPWSPSHRDGQLVIFSEDWAKVKPRTPLVALAPGFKQEITFLRSSKEPYGCDGNPTTMSSFSATKPLPEGPVWVLPAAAATNGTALPVLEQSLDQVPTPLLPANQRQRSSARAWKAGPATIVLQKQGKYKVKLTLAMNNRVVFTQQAEKYGFGNQENLESVNLYGRVEPGIPQPVGAFQLKGGQPPVIVLWQPGYEGHSFDILVPEGNTVKRFEAGSIYFCAY